jgi:hypothetical protein
MFPARPLREQRLPVLAQDAEASQRTTPHRRLKQRWMIHPHGLRGSYHRDKSHTTAQPPRRSVVAEHSGCSGGAIDAVGLWLADVEASSPEGMPQLVLDRGRSTAIGSTADVLRFGRGRVARLPCPTT